MSSVDLFFDLSPPERAAHYRELAVEMRSRASKAISEDVRVEYVKMAAQWLAMAEKLEAEYGKVSVTVESQLASLLREQGSF